MLQKALMQSNKLSSFSNSTCHEAECAQRLTCTFFTQDRDKIFGMAEAIKDFASSQASSIHCLEACIDPEAAEQVQN